MRLWEKAEYTRKDGSTAQIERDVRMRVEDVVRTVNREAASRGVRVVDVLRTAELQVLKGQRHGRVYKVPGTHGEKISQQTRALLGDYGHKLKGGVLYRASAPGEPPAFRTGNLRLHWEGDVKTRPGSRGCVEITAVLESQEKYAADLEYGIGMAPRPFVGPIMKKAEPEIKRILGEPYTQN